MPIVIDVKYQSVSTAARHFNAIDKAVKAIKDAVKDMNAELVATATTTSQIARNLQVAASGTRNARVSRGAIDPYRNNPSAGMNAVRQAALSGDPQAARAYNRYHAQQQSILRAQKRAGGGNPAGGITDMLMRTRFRMGPFAMPLGRDMMSMFGMEKDDLLRLFSVGNGLGKGALAKFGSSRGVAGRVPPMGGGAANSASKIGAAASALAGPVMVAAAAIGGMAAAAVAAREVLATYSTVAIQGGLNGMRGASAIERALGMAPGSGASFGRNINPTAASAAGVNPFGGPYGDIDYNQKFVQVFDWIRKATSFDDARRRAELAQSPELAQSWLLDDNTAGRLKKSSSRDQDEASLRTYAKFQAELAIAQGEFMQAAQSLGTPVLEVAASTLKQISGALSSVDWGLIAKGAFPAITVIKAVSDLIASITGNDIKRDSAIDKNTKALDKNTERMKEGMYGGGARARKGPNKLRPDLGWEGSRQQGWNARNGVL